jgi:hypothetical protein
MRMVDEYIAICLRMPVTRFLLEFPKENYACALSGT